MVEEQMRTQKEQAEAAISEARERSTAEKERYLRQQRDLQAQIDAAKRKQQQDEQTIKNLQDRLRRMWLRQRMKQEEIEDIREKMRKMRKMREREKEREREWEREGEERKEKKISSKVFFILFSLWDRAQPFLIFLLNCFD